MKKVLKNTFFYILLLLLFFLFLVIVDFVVGLTVDVDSQKPRAISLREIKPNSDFDFLGGPGYERRAEYIENKKTRVRTDSNGFIIGSKDKLRHENEKTKLIFFGGSTTENILIQEDLRFPYLVGQKLIGVQVLNGGVSGNHSIHSLLNLIAKGIPENPDFIIVMHGINDLGTLTKTESYWSGKIPNRNILLGDDYLHDTYNLPFLVLRDIKNRFFPNLWATARNILRHRVELLFLDEFADAREAHRGKSYNEMKEVILSNYAAAIQSIVDISENFGIRPVLMTQPNRFTLTDDFTRSRYNEKMQPITFKDFCDLYSALNNLTRKLASENGILVIDLDKKVQKDRSHMYDTIHLSTKGNELVSNLIVDSLVKSYPESFSKQLKD